MAGPAYLPLRCPSCGSGDIDTRDADGLRCRHCETVFSGRKRQSSAGSSRQVIPVLVVAALVAVAGVAVVGALVMLPSSESHDMGPIVTAPTVAVKSPLPAATEMQAPAPATALQVTPTAPAVPVEPEVVPETPAPSGPTRTLRDAEVAKIIVEAYQPLQGCSCSADLDGDARAEALQLAVAGSAVGTTITGAGTFRTFELDFLIRGPQRVGLQIDAGAQDAPARRLQGNWLDVGIGCTTNEVIIATGRSVTSWSLRDQKPAWSTELPAPYTKKGGGRDAKELVLDCGKLPIKKGAVEVRLPGGNAKLDLATGLMAL